MSDEIEITGWGDEREATPEEAARLAEYVNGTIAAYNALPPASRPSFMELPVDPTGRGGTAILRFETENGRLVGYKILLGKSRDQIAGTLSVSRRRMAARLRRERRKLQRRNKHGDA